MLMKLFELAKCDKGPENECGGVQHKGTLAEQTGLCCSHIQCIFGIFQQFFGIFRLDAGANVKAKRDLLHGHNHPTAPDLYSSQMFLYCNPIWENHYRKEIFWFHVKLAANKS